MKQIYCEDCGTKYVDGMCPNCSEELYIFETQHDDLPDKLSDEFTESVRKQQTERKLNGF